ncbi:MAG: hypothetical protein M1828_002549 [Chrysothrix sp. TS-e1954]|nr:MAG: hypothetical protein M1828_002549 [Chrysothrix sp. TS-e1954]
MASMTVAERDAIPEPTIRRASDPTIPANLSPSPRFKVPLDEEPIEDKWDELQYEFFDSVIPRIHGRTGGLALEWERSENARPDGVHNLICVMAVNPRDIENGWWKKMWMTVEPWLYRRLSRYDFVIRVYPARWNVPATRRLPGCSVGVAESFSATENEAKSAPAVGSAGAVLQLIDADGKESPEQFLGVNGVSGRYPIGKDKEIAVADPVLKRRRTIDFTFGSIKTHFTKRLSDASDRQHYGDIAISEIGIKSLQPEKAFSAAGDPSSLVCSSQGYMLRMLRLGACDEGSDQSYFTPLSIIFDHIQEVTGLRPRIEDDSGYSKRTDPAR